MALNTLLLVWLTVSQLSRYLRVIRYLLNSTHSRESEWLWLAASAAEFAEWCTMPAMRPRRGPILRFCDAARRHAACRTSYR